MTENSRPRVSVTNTKYIPVHRLRSAVRMSQRDYDDLIRPKVVHPSTYRQWEISRTLQSHGAMIQRTGIPDTQTHNLGPPTQAAGFPRSVRVAQS